MKSLFTTLIALTAISFNVNASNYDCPSLEGVEEGSPEQHAIYECIAEADDAAMMEEGYGEGEGYDSHPVFTYQEGREIYGIALFCSELCPRDSNEYWQANALVDYLRNNHYRQLGLGGAGSTAKMYVGMWHDAAYADNQYKMRKIEKMYYTEETLSMLSRGYQNLIQYAEDFGVTPQNAFVNENPGPTEEERRQMNTVTIAK